MQIPSKVYENVVIKDFDKLDEKTKKNTLSEIKMQLMMRNN